jgi:hypothetical protein
MFMNEYDIEEALRFTAYHELANLRHGAEVLSNLKDWTNANSDGWPYWQKPARAAAKLMTVLESARTAYYRGGEPLDITGPELAKALTPIKSFLTRQGVSHAEVLGG